VSQSGISFVLMVCIKEAHASHGVSRCLLHVGTVWKPTVFEGPLAHHLVPVALQRGHQCRVSGSPSSWLAAGLTASAPATWRPTTWRRSSSWSLTMSQVSCGHKRHILAPLQVSGNALGSRWNHSCCLWGLSNGASLQPGSCALSPPPSLSLPLCFLPCLEYVHHGGTGSASGCIMDAVSLRYGIEDYIIDVKCRRISQTVAVGG
jgi:hypothetical protein